MSKAAIPFRLDGKTAYVTGGGSGIGRCIAETYAQAGARVWIFDINDASAQETKEEILAGGGFAGFIHCDVTQIESVQQAVDAVLQEDGKVDIAVNNAGIGFVGNIMQTPEEDYDRVMNVNVKGVYNGCRAVIPSMLQRQNGLIINMASLASLKAIKDRFVYSVSKGAVLMLTKSIAFDYVQKGIRCNCICPTRVHTPFVDAYLEKFYPDNRDEMFQALSDYQPVGRMAKPEEVAYLALYIASDEASFHTGEAFPIAGGKTMD